jgi:hypothetical protein
MECSARMLLWVQLVQFCIIFNHATWTAANEHQYCIIGAGPAGIQLGQLLQTTAEGPRDYVIFEKAQVPGAFYKKYPRHRQLISINKRYTGKQNPDFNMRHDWNSLLWRAPGGQTSNSSMQFRCCSEFCCSTVNCSG